VDLSQTDKLENFSAGWVQFVNTSGSDNKSDLWISFDKDVALSLCLSL